MTPWLIQFFGPNEATVDAFVGYGSVTPLAVRLIDENTDCLRGIEKRNTGTCHVESSQMMSIPATGLSAAIYRRQFSIWGSTFNVQYRWLVVIA